MKKILKEEDSKLVVLFKSESGMVEFDIVRDNFLSTNFKKEEIRQGDSLKDAIVFADPSRGLRIFAAQNKSYY